MIRHTRLFSAVFSVFLSFGLQSCGLKLVDLGPAPDLYDLSPQVKFSENIPRVTWQLVVDEPSTPTSLDTDRMLVRSGSNEVRYFAEARWTERAPRIVQSQLVGAFDKSGSIVGVGRQAIGLRGDYALQGELRAFDAVYSGGSAPMVEISLTFKIVRQPSAVIIASRTFEESERATDLSLRAITASYEHVLGNILSTVVPWTLTEAQRDYEQRAVKFRPNPPLRLRAPG